MPFWILTYTSKGKPTVIGRDFALELQAQRYVDENCTDQRTIIVEAPTRNLASAKRFIKAHLAGTHHDVDEFDKHYSSSEVEKPRKPTIRGIR